MPILRVQDSTTGEWFEIPAIIGPRGPAGPEGPEGPQGEQGEVGASGVWVGSEPPAESGYNVWVNPDGRSTTDFPSSGGNVDQETISKSGVMVDIDADEGAEIKVEVDTTEAVTLVHQGKNFWGFKGNYNGVTKGGIHSVVNEDGSITLNGTATGTVYYDFAFRDEPKYIPAGIYAFSSNIELAGIMAFVQTKYTGTETTLAISNAAINRRSFKLEENAGCHGSVQINSDTVCDNLTIWVQLERGTSVDYGNHPEQFTAYEKCTRTEISTSFPATVEAFEGTNIFYTTGGDVLTVEAPKRTVKYVLPIGGTELGGVKNGGNVVINADGTMTAPTSGNANTEIVTKTGVVVGINQNEGNKITVDSDNGEIVTLVHHGKNFIKFDPSQNGTTKAGINIIVNDDGSVTLNGTATSNAYIDWAKKADPIYLPAGIYAFSTNLTEYNIGGITAYVQTERSDITGTTTPGISKAGTAERSFKLSEGIPCYGMMQVNSGVTCDNITVWMQLERGTTIDYTNHPEQFTEYEKCVRTTTSVALPTTIDALDGTNILYTTSGDVLNVSYQREKSNINEDVVNSLIADALKFDPRPYGIPVLTLDGDCAGMTKDNYVSLEFTFKDKDKNPINGVAEVKKQGSSSISIGTEIGRDFDTDVGGLYNFTIKFPEAFEAKDGWGSQKKYVFKANAIDHSHARNICSCKLWGQIVKSRANVPTELSSLPNGGAIDGFPIAIVLNGKFYALGTFNIPKDGWMFGNPKAIVCADAHTDATKFKVLATMNGDFELEYVEDEDNADWVLTSLNRAIQAVIDSDGSDIDSVIGQYIDIPSAIDYYIHTVNESADDGTSKNYILVTFDGTKWYFSAYDRDTTYGIQYDGKKFHKNVTSGSIHFARYAGIHKLMELIYNHKKTELKNRAIQLNNNITSEFNVYDVFVNFIAGIPAELYAQNCKRWPLLRSTSASNLDQILNWYRMHRVYLDKLIEEM